MTRRRLLLVLGLAGSTCAGDATASPDVSPPAPSPAPLAEPAAPPPATPAPVPPPPTVANGERLDGRQEPDGPSSLLMVPRAILYVPRAVFTVVAVPTAWAAEEIEERKLYSRLYWALTTDDGLAGIRPEVRFESDSYLMGGFRYFNKRALGPGSLFEMRARTGGPNQLFGEVSLQARGFSWFVQGERRNDATFAGTEGQTKDELEEEGFAVTRFGFDRVASQLGYERELREPLTLQASVGFSLYNFNDGTSRGGDPRIDQVWCSDCAAGVVDEALVPGFNEGVRRVRAEAALAFDTRSHHRYSTGFAGRFAAAWAHGVADDPSHDVMASADVVGTLDLEDRAIGLRLRAAVIEPLDAAPVPFIALVGASGRQGIRALRSGRLRGNSGFVGTAFYRYMLTPNVDFMLFADYGGAFGSWFDNFSADHLIDGYGFGVWLYGTKGRYFEGEFFARIEAAWAPGEGSRIVFVTELD